MLLTDKITVADTGQGFTTTYSHKVHTDRNGVPCPVLCFLTKGHKNERRVYQIINDSKGFVISSIGKEGKIRYKNNTITTYGTWDVGELGEDSKAMALVKKLAQEINEWKAGRECHFPPMSKVVTPEIYAIERIPKYLHHPGMEGGFLLGGGGKGERNGSLFVSKRWKLSMPHLIEWENPTQLTIRKDNPLKLNGGCIYVAEEDKVVIIEKELAKANFLCATADGEEVTLVLNNNGTSVMTKVGGRFRCGIILPPKGE
jgi:hypothetical protein